ncbi:class I glutamine amidotransferase-like protein [Xylariomycetidae sp. FL0641]|nr:class I glutamine amidotransferase-like protein [Xylariomycetidae sp. FL0641]
MELDEPQIITPGTSVASPKVIFLMADYGHDPTETAVPYTAFKQANYQISFATENGKSPRCDKKMLEGFTQKLLGAKKDVVAMYKKMQRSTEMLHPLSWTAPDFSLDPFDLVVLPGGHDKGVRQIIESDAVHRLMLDYFPQTQKPGQKAVAAVCHGVLVLAESKDANGRSVIRDCLTTALPSKFEQGAYWGTRAFLGDYYKTYGHGSEDVETAVTKVLGHPAQFKSSLNPGPFVVEDEQYNYISARYPGDAETFAEESIKLLESFHRIV